MPLGTTLSTDLTKSYERRDLEFMKSFQLIKVSEKPNKCNFWVQNSEFINIETHPALYRKNLSGKAELGV